MDLREAFAKLSGRSALRAVVLTGAGERAFIGGADLNELGALCADSARLFITRLHQACEAIRDCPVPVIGRINGFCLGAGLEVAASCDFRAAAESAQLRHAGGAHGHPVGDRGGAAAGPDRLGPHARDAADGRALFGAEALDMGFVQKVAPRGELDAAIEPWLAGICRATPEAVRSQKALIDRWERVSIDEGIYAGIDALVGRLQDRRAAGRHRGVLLKRKKTKG